MRHCVFSTILLLLAAPLRGDGQSPSATDSRPSSPGASRIPFRPYSPDDDKATLELFQGLRVADVSDGMDVAGLQDVGLMNRKIQPLWRDLDRFSHRFCGIAVTVRYLPTNKRASRMSLDEFK